MNLNCLEIARSAGLPSETRKGVEVLFKCPRHDDTHPSLSINPKKNVWMCGFCGTSGNAWQLAAFVAGLMPEDKKAVSGWLRDKGILDDYGYDTKRIIATYPYRDENGNLLFEVVRFDPKDFRQRKPDGNGGWIWNSEGINRVPYRLNEWKDKPTVYIAEGEKDADTLWNIGFPATTNPMGARNWRPEYNQFFDNKQVLVFRDNDSEGEDFQKSVVRNLFGVTRAIKTINLPNLKPKEDISDWFEAGGTKEELIQIIRDTPVVTQADINSWIEVQDSAPSQITCSWPEIAPEAFQGLTGNIVQAINPYTEADPVSILLHLLAGFGNLIGPRPHFRIANDNHPARLFVAIIGDSSKARKGTTWGPLREIFQLVDQDYVDKRVRSGLSTGEGLIYHVRDSTENDSGESDKRLLCIEEEFSSMLVLMSREGNSLSGIIRKSWDSGNLATLTKKDPLTASSAHVSIIGHSTRDELLRHLSRTEQANGFANRFLWALARRSKLLPDGGSVPTETIERLAKKLKRAVQFAQDKVKEVKRDDMAGNLWREIYGDLSSGRPGLLGAILNRSETQVVRLSLIYALLDSSPIVTVDHLKAALAVWDYCEASVRFTFGEEIGNPDADRILNALRQAPSNRMSDEEMQRNVFKNHGGHNKTSALAELVRLGRVQQEKGDNSGGRTPTIWALAS